MIEAKRGHVYIHACVRVKHYPKNVTFNCLGRKASRMSMLAPCITCSCRVCGQRGHTDHVTEYHVLVEERARNIG